MKKMLLISLLAVMMIMTLGTVRADASVTTTLVSVEGWLVDVTADASFLDPWYTYSYSLAYNNHNLYHFRVYNNGWEMTSFTSPNSNWTYTFVGGEDGYVTWDTFNSSFTTADPVTSTNTPLSGFSFQSKGEPGLITAAAWNGGGNLDGVTLGPVPEPASMLMLGMGLLGFAGSAFRRKFMHSSV